MENLYRPNTIKDYGIHQNIIKEISNWLVDWENGTQKKPLILQGDAGCGKSLLITLLFKDKKYDIIDFQPNFTSTHKNDMKRLKTYITTNNIFNMIEKRKKIILFDNIDIGNTWERGYITDLLQLLIELKKYKNKKIHPSVYTISKPIKSKKLASIKREAFLLEIPKISNNDLYSIAVNINIHSKLKLDIATLKYYSNNSFGDICKLRQNILLDLKKKNKIISDKDLSFKPIYSIEEYLNPKIDADIDIYISIFNSEPLFTVPNIYDNAWNILDKIYTGDNNIKYKYYKIILDNIINWGIIDNYYGYSLSYYNEYKAIFGIAQNMVIIRKLRQQYTFSTVLLKTSNLYSRISQSSFNYKSIKELSNNLNINPSDFNVFSYILAKILIDTKYDIKILCDYLISKKINMINFDRIIKYNCISFIIEKKINSNRKNIMRKLINKHYKVL